MRNAPVIPGLITAIVLLASYHLYRGRLVSRLAVSRRGFGRWNSRLRILTSVLGVIGCGGVGIQDPDENGIARDELVVRTLVPEEDSAAASALGWDRRIIPNTEVWIELEGADGRIGARQTATTDASGVARFQNLLPGSYRLSALRILTAGEVSSVPLDRPLLRAFGGATRVQSKGDVELILRPNRTGLMISEVYANDKPGITYIWHGYVEIYNNSDQIVYLDGRLLGRMHSSSRSTNCTVAMQYQNSPSGIWSRLFQRFPGNGAEYAVPPGGIVLVAQDAIDHRAVDPEFLDLSNADFEMRTSSDPDNPGVPDLTDAGTRAAVQNGIQFLPGYWPPFLADAISTSGLPRARVLQTVDDEFVQIPGESVSDVLTWIDADPTTPTPICTNALSGAFDQSTLRLQNTDQTYLQSEQRRVIGLAPGGWTILLDTNTSSVDFMRAARTPGALPPS